MMTEKLPTTAQNFVDSLSERFPGAQLTFRAKDLVSGFQIAYGSDGELECASIVKIFLAYIFFANKKDLLNVHVEVSPELKNSLYGAGVLKCFKHSCSMSYRDLIVLMLCLSDNIATNLVIDALGGVQQIKGWMKSSLGISSTGLVQPISNELKGSGNLSLFKAEDFMRFFEHLENEACPELRSTLISIMQDTTSMGNDRLARGLPTRLLALDSDAIVASKGGTFTRPEVSCDLLYVKEAGCSPFVLFAHTIGVNDPLERPRGHVDHAANQVLAELGALIFDEIGCRPLPK